MKKRCLIIVRNGVADYVCDKDVNVEIFDFDNYEADPDSQMIPENFRDLATDIIPDEAIA